MSTYYVYILTNAKHTALYVGVTNDLPRRIAEHKAGNFGGFTKKYNVHKLVYIETYPEINAAIAREKQLKNWRREKKIALIQSMNPAWDDLSADPSTRSARSG